MFPFDGMNGYENQPAPPPAPRPAGELASEGSLRPGAEPSGEPGSLRGALQGALSQLAESARLLRGRDAPQEDLLASAAAEIGQAAALLERPDGREREEAVRRLRRLGEEMNRLARARAEAEPPPRPARARPRLLVADDEADARELLSEALGGDYEILTAADGQEAVEQVQARRPDLLLLDLNMPRLDGFAVLEALRADPSTSELPVILISARSDDAGKVRALDQGAVDYLQKPFSERELRARIDRTLRLVRRQLALRELAQTDALTGLANVRAFRARLEDELKRARRYRTPLTCVMADMDGLKPINDELGHAAGDRAIAAVAAVVQEQLRETDFGARYGGDEFVILLPHTTAEDGRVFAERVSARLRAAEVRVGDRRIHVGASFGVACRDPDAPDEPPDALVHAADAALYAAKRGGGGQVAVADGLTP